MVCGYQFGGSNHTVYLVEALRINDPSLLKNDWWATATLQYHGVFTKLSALLMRFGVIRPAFFTGYLALILLMHLAWLRLVQTLGRSVRVYLASVVLFYLSAAGFGLGMYHFLQDSSFLPSNIANVAMLWGIYLWISGRAMGAGVCLGIAGLFHLNHALAGIALWAALSAWNLWDRRNKLQTGPPARSTQEWLIATSARAFLSAINTPRAARAVLAHRRHLPLHSFVELYVR